MKYLYLLFAFVICSFGLQAQITITQSNMPKAGDSLRYSIAAIDTSILLNYQKSGANQQWHFDSIKAQRQNVHLYYKSSNTPYSINNKIGDKIADTISQQGITFYDLYEFYTSTSSSFSKDQRAGTMPTALPFLPTIKITPTYSDKDEIYQFPLDYNDRDSSTFKFTFTNGLIGVYYGSNGYRINSVDGWGTVYTPYGSFSCLKVVTDIVSYDSAAYNNNNTGSAIHTREYKWLTTQLRMPAFKLSGTVVGGQFIPATVEYRDSVRNVPSIFSPLAVFIANPRTLIVGDTLRFTNSSISINQANYKWSISPNTYTYINGTNAQSENPTVVFNDSGYYDVQLIASNSKGADTMLRKKYIRVNLTITTLKEFKNNQIDFEVIPNPAMATSRIEVVGKVPIQEIQLISVQGRLVYQKQLSENSKTVHFNSPNVPSGIYFIKVISPEGIGVSRIVIQN